jgi:CDP-paratose 2-epimerase
VSHANILITGGAGFVGSNLALRFRRDRPRAAVTALDNLKRRGSELNLPRLRDAGVRFVHGDIRCPEDLAGFRDDFDLIVDCSAEPSVQAGYGDHPGYVIQTNLTGTVNCLELARRHRSDFVFLSTSRVYPIGRLNALPLEEQATRFELASAPDAPGISARGVAEDFPLSGHRSLYGATKLASELLVQEYAEAYGLRTVINRCGVIGGPGQMGKADQGVFAYWLLAHHFRRPLRYIGYGGTGKQVRDLLHVEDLYRLLKAQLAALDELASNVFNVGGGAWNLSLYEATALCRDLTGHAVPIEAVPENRPGDVPWYVTDNARVTTHLRWQPRTSPQQTLADLHAWVVANEGQLQTFFH